MNEKFKFEFDRSTGILFKYYYGKITIEDITSSWVYAFANNIIPKEVRGFILDYRNANFDFDIKEHIKIVEFYKKHLDVFGDLKIAIITEKPKDIIIPMMVETKDEGYYSKPFSTIEAAIAWVLI
ncbi:MAG: hypothetical protein JXB24_11525 [Bacteroidales bacterium]|nr:hypothetical protein [Bacteroidales bacterium]